MTEQFLTLMADLDEESQALMSEWSEQFKRRDSLVRKHRDFLFILVWHPFRSIRSKKSFMKCSVSQRSFLLYRFTLVILEYLQEGEFFMGLPT